MANKRFIVTKKGQIVQRRVKGGKNLTANYRIAGYARSSETYKVKRKGKTITKTRATSEWRPVYQRHDQAMTTIKPVPFFKIVEFFKPKKQVQMRIIGPPPEETKQEGGRKVVATGIASVNSVSEKALKPGHAFHAELLFQWYGSEQFDAGALVEAAVSILINNLPEIDRISFGLANSCQADDSRGGVEHAIPYDGSSNNEMRWEIFIPRVGGRALYSGVSVVDENGR